MENYANQTHFDFSGGVNQAVGRLVKSGNETDHIENGYLDEIGGITKSSGYTQRGADVATGYEILGLCSAYKSDGTMKQIAVADGAANSDAYTYNPTTNTWTDHNLSLSTGAKAEFEYFLDGFFMVNFEDATRWNDFTQWYTTTNVTNAPKGKYIILYQERIYIAYVVDGASTYPSRVIYSDLPSSGTIAWDNANNWFDVDQDNSDVIKGMTVNSSRLLIFKENSLYRYDTNTLYKVPGAPGTTSQRSVKECMGWTFYLHSSGIWGYNGETSKLMSRKIKNIIGGISTKNLVNACAYVDGDHYYLYVGDIDDPKTGLTITKCEIDYDVAKNAFSWNSLDKEPTVYASFRDDRSAVTYDDATKTYDDADTTYDGLMSSEQRVYFGATDGAVYHHKNGNTQDGTDIGFMVETRDFYLGYPSHFKLLQKVVVYVKPSGRGIVLQYKLDDKNWETLGRVDEVQKELIFPAAARCKRVKFRIAEKSGGGQLTFEGLDIYYIPEGLVE